MTLSIRDLAIVRIAGLVNGGHLIEAKAKLDLLMTNAGSDVHKYPLAVRALYARIANKGKLPANFVAYPSREAERAAAGDMAGKVINESAATEKIDTSAA